MTTETLQFKTELKQLLYLIVHSLYSHKDIFLRELISNASDAIDTIRFQSLTKPDMGEGNADWKITLFPDRERGTLTVSDNGVGMSKEEIVENLGTIARSGTRAFLDALKNADAKDRPELIGQFGVGFYSSFMVADRVTVVSRTAGSKTEGVQWESDGQGAFTVESVAKQTRGTEVTLHLREEDKGFLDEWRIRQIVKQYSDFVEHPIVLEVERAEDGQKKKAEETLNSRKAIWLRPKAQVSAEEYHEFYRHLTHETGGPAKTIHYNAEGQIEFRALLYLPAHLPFDLHYGDRPRGLHLYIQRVFIMDDCEALLPTYLRFVRGVVDSPDLPLNVSREILQQSAPLEKIKSNLTNKVLATLDELKRKEYDAYLGFYREMGVFLKEGISQDWSHRDQLADLLLCESTKTAAGSFTTLAQYVEGMTGEPQEIWYLTGESRALLDQSPLLESFRAAGTEVLLLNEPIDEFVVQALTEYKGKKLKAVDRGALEAAAIPAETQQKFQPLLDAMKAQVAEVKDVRLSRRLKESAVCLVADEGAMSAHLEQLLRRMNREREQAPAKRILEVNAEHPAVAALRQLHAQDPADARVEAYCRLLYDEALIAEGSKVADPLAFARRVNELLVRGAAT